MSQELKPCAHCGNTLKPTIKEWEGDGFPGYVVVCDAYGFDGTPGLGCGASSGWGETPDEAAAAWNRRTANEAGVLHEASIENAARQIWLYFRGRDETAVEAGAWFDNNKNLGGPKRIIELVRSALSSPPSSQGSDQS